MEAPHLFFASLPVEERLHMSSQIMSDNEILALNSEELAAAESDLLGATEAFKKMSLATPDMDSLLRALDAEVAKVPEIAKTAFFLVQNQCPHLVDNDHKISFLQAEDFDVRKAAERLIEYWNYRYELFGPDKWLLPMTLRGAMRDDTAALLQGYFELIPAKDEFGRGIIFVHASKHDPSKYTQESMIRTMWYMLHVAAKDPEVKERGVIFLLFSRYCSVFQADFKMIKGFVRLSSCLPVIWRGAHQCHPPFFARMLYPALKFALGRRMTLRYVTHEGPEALVLQSLSRYGLNPSSIPTDMGGQMELNSSKWYYDRMAIEAIPPDGPTKSGLDGLALLSSVCAHELTPKRPPTLSSRNMLLGNSVKELSSGREFSGDNMDVKRSAKKRRGIHKEQAALAGNGASSSSEPMPKNVPGRRGDQRMNRAVHARLNDLAMTSLAALRAGGFVFPDYGKPGILDERCFDTDNISLTQRKNQLSRRIRNALKKRRVET